MEFKHIITLISSFAVNIELLENKETQGNLKAESPQIENCDFTRASPMCVDANGKIELGTQDCVEEQRDMEWQMKGHRMDWRKYFQS